MLFDPAALAIIIASALAIPVLQGVSSWLRLQFSGVSVVQTRRRSLFSRALSDKLGALVGLLLFVSLSSSAFSSDPPPVRIMPLGDSSTSGFSVPTFAHGYRGTLYNTLSNAGYAGGYV